MKFLHIADLHLGLKIEGVSRLEEQREILEEITLIAEQNCVDAVLICGDVFQKSVPSAEAEDLFYEFIAKLSDDGKRFVFVIAGNHDDSKRLYAGSHLAKKHNIMIVGDFDSNFNTNSFSKNEICVSNCGKGFVELNINDEKMVIGYLPYPSRSRMNAFDSNKSYEDNIKDWANLCVEHFSKDSFNVFVSHLFLDGGKYFNSGNEKEVEFDDPLAVKKECLPKAHYYALGHLHKHQEVFPNAFYTGCIVRTKSYSSTPSVNIVSGNRKGVEKVEVVPLFSAFDYRQIFVTNFDDAVNELAKCNRTWVELVFERNEPLLISDIKKIKNDYPFVVNIKIVKDAKQNKFLNNFISKKEISEKELFENFYISKKNKKPNKDIVDLFLEVLKEKEDETD